MRKAILVLTIGSTFLALILQTALFEVIAKQQIREKSMSENTAFLENMQTELSSYIKDVVSDMLSIYNETELIDALSQCREDTHVLKDRYWDAFKFAKKKFEPQDKLYALYVYTAENELVSTYRYDAQNYPLNIFEADYDVNTAAVEKYLAGNSKNVLISGYYNEVDDRNLIRIVLKLHEYNESRGEIGYLICDFSEDIFENIIRKYVADEETCLWLQPEGDCAVSAAGNCNRNENRTYVQISDMIARDGDTSELGKEYDGFYLITVENTEGYHLTAFSLVSQSFLIAAHKSLVRILVVLAAFLFLLEMAVTIAITNRLFKPVEEMKDTIVKIKAGDTALRVRPIGWSEELEILGNEFNEMLDRVQLMVQEEYEAKLLVERTEYKMLQAQINPHFLYNTLDTMSGIANVQNCPLVSSMCQSLSAIFRYCLDMSDAMSSVQKEMAHVRNYLYVMDVRNGSTIEYEYRIDSDTMADLLPRISIQPIVENAISHGLRKVRRKDKKLIIAASHECAEDEPEKLIITVEDNGSGMDADAMNEMLEQNDTSRIENGVSIGVLNVNARLRKLFGAEYGIKIESVLGEGTRVKITVPAVREGEV